jgi:hypothetical protein
VGQSSAKKKIGFLGPRKNPNPGALCTALANSESGPHFKGWKAEKRTFGGLPGVWRGGFSSKAVANVTSPGTVPIVIGRGSGSPIRRIFRDNPPNVRRAYNVTWEVFWPLIGQNIYVTNVVRGDDTGGRFWQRTQKQRQS